MLKEAGIPLETALKYGDDKGEDFCILSLAFGEGYADLYDGKKFIAFENIIELKDVKKEQTLSFIRMNLKNT